MCYIYPNTGPSRGSSKSIYDLERELQKINDEIRAIKLQEEIAKKKAELDKLKSNDSPKRIPLDSINDLIKERLLKNLSQTEPKRETREQELDRLKREGKLFWYSSSVGTGSYEPFTQERGGKRPGESMKEWLNRT